MALTEHRLRTTRTTAPIRPTLPAPLSTSWALSLGLAWVAFNVIAALLEPAPARTLGLWEDVVIYAQLGSLLLVAAGLARRRTWAAGASLGASAFFTAGVFACPATGHHTFGLRWIGEFAAVLALTALSGVAWMRTRRV